MPGRRVSRNSIGIDLPPFCECRGWEQSVTEHLRLLHEDDAERRRDQYIEARKGDELRLLRPGDSRVLGCELGEDDGELAVSDQRHAGVEALALREPADTAGKQRTADLSGERDGNCCRDDPADVADRG